MQKMYEIDHRYLKFVDFTQFEKWDVKRHYHKSNIEFSNEVVLLGNILKPFKKGINKEYIINNKLNIISKINFGGELFLRDFEEINTYKGNLFLVPENSIIYSKINVRHGCIYYHQKNETPFAVSNEYPIYTFDEKRIDGRFIQKLIRSNYFKNLLNTKTSGISKARVKQDEFLDIQIPLPNIAEQKAILDDYQQKIENAKQLETEAQILEESIEKYLFEELGIVEDKSVSKKGFGLRFFDFSNIDRWDVWTKKNLFESSKYKYQNFEKIIIGKPLYGANVKGVHKHSNTRYIRITDINESGDLNNDFVSPEFVEEKYLLQENDFLIARSGNTVGKTFLYKNHFGRAIYAGYLIKFNINSNIAFPEYVFEFTKSKIFKDWINSNQRISGQPNINGQEYLSAPFLIPPLEKQKEIAEHISTIKDNIKSLKQNAETLKAEAEKEFEEKIFN